MTREGAIGRDDLRRDSQIFTEASEGGNKGSESNLETLRFLLLDPPLFRENFYRR